MDLNDIDLESPNEREQREMEESLKEFERHHGLAEIFCPERPELLKGAPIGMYHCPCCGVMLLAGLSHPKVVLYDTGEIDYSYL